MRPSPARLLLAFFSETERILPPGSLGRLIAALSRSEEHTSELQSQSNLVCRLLLEKKKIPHCAPAASPATESSGCSSAAPVVAKPGSPAGIIKLEWTDPRDDAHRLPISTIHDAATP